MTTLLIVTSLAISTFALILISLILGKLKQPVGESLDQALREELRQSREEASNQARELREEVAAGQANVNSALVQTVNLLGNNQKTLLEDLTRSSKDGAGLARVEIEKLVQRTDGGLKEIQKSSEDRSEQLRRILDEKLRQMMDDQKDQLAAVVVALQGLEKSH